MVMHRDAFRRLCRARDLLGEPREPAPSIEQVARQVAISPSHFTRQFEALFGLLPGCLDLIGALPPDAFRSFREA